MKVVYYSVRDRNGGWKQQQPRVKSRDKILLRLSGTPPPPQHPVMEFRCATLLGKVCMQSTNTLHFWTKNTDKKYNRREKITSN